MWGDQGLGFDLNQLSLVKIDQAFQYKLLFLSSSDEQLQKNANFVNDMIKGVLDSLPSAYVKWGFGVFGVWRYNV